MSVCDAVETVYVLKIGNTVEIETTSPFIAELESRAGSRVTARTAREQ